MVELWAKTIRDHEDDESFNTRKKSPFSTLHEATPQKKETPVPKWLPNGDEVIIWNWYIDDS